MAGPPRWMSDLMGDAAPPNPASLDDIAALRRLAAGGDVVDFDGVDRCDVDVELRAAAPNGPRLGADVLVPASTNGHGLIWLHGGAWCLGDAAAARPTAAAFARAGFVVVDLDYSLAPEHPFPQAVQDTLDAIAWARRHADSLGIDADRLLVGGTSAGANLSAAALVAALSTDERVDGAGVDPSSILGLVLLYGVFDFALLNGDTRDNAGYVEWLFNRAYLGPQFLSRQADPLVSPVRAEVLDRFPPTFVGVGARDHLLPQSLAMIDALARVDVDVTAAVAAGLDHSYDAFDTPAARAELQRCTDWAVRQVANRPEGVAAM